MGDANLKKGFILVLLLATGCIYGVGNSSCDDTTGWTGLHFAVQEGKTEIVKLLLI